MSEPPPTMDYATPAPKRDRLWIVALVLSLAGAVVPLTGFIGAFLGRVADRRKANHGGSYRSHALAAIVIGLLFGVINSVVLIAVLLHVANRYEVSGRVHCASTMRALGSVMQLYAAESRSMYPLDLSAILNGGYGCVPRVFLCPRGDGVIASANFTSDPAARAANNLDYIYVGEGMTSKTVLATEPILFERLSNHNHDGGNVLFGDGHVEFMTKLQILRLLEPLRGTPRLTPEEYDAITAP